MNKNSVELLAVKHKIFVKLAPRCLYFFIALFVAIVISAFA